MCFNIKLDQPAAPFSQEPGSSFRIPGTALMAVIYPARLEIGEFTWDLPLSDRATSFKAVLDLRKGAIWVFVQTVKEYFRYRVVAKEGQVKVSFDRGWKKDFFIETQVIRPTLLEEIGTGVYKSQEWEKILRRKDPREILPLWFLASQWYPESGSTVDMAHFLESFGAIFSPRKESFTGYKGGRENFFPRSALRALIAEEGLSLKVPSFLPAGRAKNLRVGRSLVDVEWSNGALKKAVIVPMEDDEISISFPASYCRMRLFPREKGQEVKKGQILSCKKGIPLFFDRFIK